MFEAVCDPTVLQAVVVALVYLLGMLTGGSVASLFRWAVSDVIRRPEG